MVFKRKIRFCGCIVLVTLCLSASAVYSQDASVPQAIASVATETLPDAPSVVMTAAIPDPFAEYDQQPASRTRPARKYHRVVQPDQIAPPLSGGDKLELSVMSRLTAGDAFATVFAAGFSQWRDSRPHFGSDSGAFGQRLGALALKQTTQSIFSYGLFATAFHDDPRYYVLGDGHKIVNRAVYSATRLVIAKKNDGRAAANWPKLAGIVSAGALTATYYPQSDRNFKDTTINIASSLGTSVLDNEIHEFLGDVVRLVHHRK